jgi:hypothetical protein
MVSRPEDVYLQPLAFPQVLNPKTIITKSNVASEVNQDDRDCLSDSHRDFMLRYVEYELEKQEQASKSFLRERFKPSVSQAE